jgi:hypothetical protein
MGKSVEQQCRKFPDPVNMKEADASAVALVCFETGEARPFEPAPSFDIPYKKSLRTNCFTSIKHSSSGCSIEYRAFYSIGEQIVNRTLPIDDPRRFLGVVLAVCGGLLTGFQSVVVRLTSGHLSPTFLMNRLIALCPVTGSALWIHADKQAPADGGWQLVTRSRARG